MMQRSSSPVLFPFLAHEEQSGDLIVILHTHALHILSPVSCSSAVTLHRSFVQSLVFLCYSYGRLVAVSFVERVNAGFHFI
jgi:hypothetical protein